jgi:hypothetical protein
LRPSPFLNFPAALSTGAGRQHHAEDALRHSLEKAGAQFLTAGPKDGTRRSGAKWGERTRRSRRLLGPAILAISLFSLALAPEAEAASYYVDAVNGSDSRAGTPSSAAWKTLAKVSRTSFKPGDFIYLRRGRSWNESLTLSSHGKSGAPITVGAYGSGDNPVIFSLTIKGDYWVAQNLVIDHKKQAGDAVRLQRAKNCILRRLTVRNGINDGIDVDGAHGLLIDRCHIYNFLAGSFSNQVDAHGIVATDTRGLTIQRTEIHHVSGDCFQTDPDRDSNYPDNIVIRDCVFWTSPLSSNFNSGWRAGQRPGENAIDTKVAKPYYENAPRMRITVKNTVAFGWKKDGYIAHRAAFNMKEKVEAVFDCVRVYDCEIAFRLRGLYGNANTTLKNVVIYNCEKAIRAEDNLAKLKIYNCTFGDALGTQIEIAGGSGGTGTWSLRNNAFVGKKHALASHSSNRLAGGAEFISTSARDYRLRSSSKLIDAGVSFSGVPSIDLSGFSRPCGRGYDVGAHEYCGQTLGIAAAPSGKFVRGDVDGDGRIATSDGVALAKFLAGGAEPLCLSAADVNDDGLLSLPDASLLLQHLFWSREPLPPPFGSCGTDPTGDGLSCEGYTPCDERPRK